MSASIYRRGVVPANVALKESSESESEAEAKQPQVDPRLERLRKLQKSQADKQENNNENLEINKPKIKSPKLVANEIKKIEIIEPSKQESISEYESESTSEEEEPYPKPILMKPVFKKK
jgi:hypothetical protein